MATLAAQVPEIPPAGDEPGYEMVLDISPEVRDLLARLAAEAGGTEIEVVGKAISLYRVASEARRAGKRLGIFDADLELEQEILGL